MESRVEKGNVAPPACAACGTYAKADHISPSFRGAFPAPTKANGSPVEKTTTTPKQGTILAVCNCTAGCAYRGADDRACDSTGYVRTAAFIHNFVGVKNVLSGQIRSSEAKHVPCTSREVRGFLQEEVTGWELVIWIDSALGRCRWLLRG